MDVEDGRGVEQSVLRFCDHKCHRDRKAASARRWRRCVLWLHRGRLLFLRPSGFAGSFRLGLFPRSGCRGHLSSFARTRDVHLCQDFPRLPIDIPLWIGGHLREGSRTGGHRLVELGHVHDLFWDDLRNIVATFKLLQHLPIHDLTLPFSSHCSVRESACSQGTLRMA